MKCNLKFKAASFSKFKIVGLKYILTLLIGTKINLVTSSSFMRTLKLDVFHCQKFKFKFLYPS